MTIYYNEYAKLITISYTTIFHLWHVNVQGVPVFSSTLSDAQRCGGQASPLSSRNVNRTVKRKLVRSEEPLNNSCFMAAELHAQMPPRARIPAE